MQREKVIAEKKTVSSLPSILKVRSPNLTNKIYDISSENIFLCLECQKCSSGCPMTEDMDYPPSYLTHLIRLGLIGDILNTNTFWLCLSCMTCSTRCPQGIDIAKVMDALKIIAQKEGILPDDSKISAFYKSMLGSISSFGRVYELGMIMMLKLRTMNLFNDLDLGVKMIRKGKIKLLPSFSDRSRINKIIKKVYKRENRIENTGA